MATALGDPALLIEATVNLALVSAAAGEFEEALRLSGEGVSGATAVGDLKLAGMAMNARGVVLWESGDIAGSHAVTQQARER